MKEFHVYKGVQKPVVFKSFKGKYIYIAFGCLLLSIILCIIVSNIAGFLFGGIVLILVAFGGLAAISTLQKNGLHNKKINSGLYIVQSIFQRNYE